MPQNLAGLFSAIGGNASVVAKLDTFFTQLNAGRKQPYDWAGDEPSLGIPWEYDYAGAPARTQAVVRKIVTTLYGPTPNGEPGNDDLGAMSSWYVWAATGPLPRGAGPGRARARQPPLPPHHHRPRERRAAIVIDAPGASPGTPYVQSLDVAGLDPAGEAGARPSAGSGAAPSRVRVSVVAGLGERLGGRARLHPGPHARPRLGGGPTEAPPSFPAP